MVTKESLKNEIDKVDDVYMEALYKVIEAFTPANKNSYQKDKKHQWKEFIEDTYGSFRDEPLIRPNQGTYEIREVFK